jgi:peptide/nickel transport system substrate-binding protein
MKKVFVPLAILIVLAFVLSACGGGATTTTTTPPTSTAPTSTAPVTTTAPTTTTAPVTSTTKPPTTTTTPPTTTPASNKYGGTITVIESLAPGAPLGAEWEGNLGTYNTQQWAEERMLKEKLDGTMQGELAESWEVTSSGDTPNVVFHLRKGVKFHDGTDWNAAALAWNLDMFKKGNMFGSTTNYWKSWDIIDDYTLRLNYSLYLNTLTRAWENYFFVSPAAYTKNGIEWVRTHMVGTAGFMQTDFQRDVSTTFVKNNNYWQQGKPYPDKVVLTYVVDELTREALMKSGGGDVLYATLKQISRFATPDFTTISRAAGPTILAPDSRNADSPWSKVNVRMAADYAIDKAGIAQALGYGVGTPAYQLSSPNTLAFDPTLESKYRKLDLAKAKQLLTDAGYPNGFKTSLIVQPGSDVNMAVSVQANLSKIGITVSIETPDSASFQAISTTPQKLNSLIQINVNEWSNYNTTINVFFPKTGGGFYLPSLAKPGGQAAYDALIDRSRATPAPDPAILKEIGDAYFNDCSVIPLMYLANVFVLSNRLQDSGLLKFGTFNSWDYSNVWLKK